MSVTVRSRIAPTPSGYLHLGNLANFLLTEKLVREAGGELLLRIDDCDTTRARPEFVEHIFSALRWLGIDWREGPRDADDFDRNFSQATRKENYFERLGAISAFTYACDCSRKTLEAEPCACRVKKKPFERGKIALRLCFEAPELARRFGAPVLWRKDDGPAYHWFSVVNDLDSRLNLIVRGEDLRDSTDLQKQIAALVTPGGLDHVRFVHHPLLLDEAGQKLSKSARSASFLEKKDAGVTPDELRATLAGVIQKWGY